MADFDFGDFGGEADFGWREDAGQLASAGAPGGGEVDFGWRADSGQLANLAQNVSRLDPSSAGGGGAAGGGWGSGWSDWFKDAGNLAGGIAKVAAPAVGLGTGIMGIIAQRDAASRAAQQQPVIDSAQKTQLDNAQRAQPLADQAAALSPKVESVAPKLDAVASKIAAQTGQPVVDYASQLLTKAQAGEIPDAYKAKIENWRQAAKAKVLDYLARSGQADSSARVQLEAWVDQQAEAMSADILGSQEERALGAFEQGRGAYVSEADVLGREAATYGAAAVPLGTAGSILTGSSGSAGQVANSARAEEQSLEELIAQANRNITRVAAGAA